jgi:hypothetical protein
MISFDQFF